MADTQRVDAQRVDGQSQEETDLQAAGRIPADLALIKIENETMFSVAAVRKKRDLRAVCDNVLDQVKKFPSFAKAAIYCKPVGREKDEHGNFKKDANGRDIQKYARGLSIRTAEALAEAYGYNRVSIDVDEIDADTVKIRASFIDYQQCRSWASSAILKKFYKTKFGKIVRIDEDRFYNVNVKARASIEAREVVIRCVPPGIRQELYEEIEEVLASRLTPEEVNKLVAAFMQTFKVSPDMIQARLGKSLDDLTKDDRVMMLGLYTALKDGETTVDEAFGESKTPEDMKAKVAAGKEAVKQGRADGAAAATADAPKKSVEQFVAEQATGLPLADKPEAPAAEAAAPADPAPTVTCRKCLAKGQPADGPCAKCNDPEPAVERPAKQ